MDSGKSSFDMESKPHICSFCNIAFISIRSLDIHLRFLHKQDKMKSKEAEMRCKYCNQPFCTIRKHEKRCKEFYRLFIRNEVECMICQKPYSSIRKHLSAKHGYEMAQIQGSFVSMINQQFKSTDRHFVCDICDKVFKKKRT